MIGLYGTILFHSGTGSITTFDELKKTVSARWETHEIFQDKPLLEYGGPQLIEVSFSMCFIKPMTMDPTAGIIALQQIMDLALPLPLILGVLPVGRGSSLFVMTELEVNPKYFFQGGSIMGAAVEVKLKEYVEGNILNSLQKLMGGGQGGDTTAATTGGTTATGETGSVTTGELQAEQPTATTNGNSYGFNADTVDSTQNTQGFNADATAGPQYPAVADDVRSPDVAASSVATESGGINANQIGSQAGVLSNDQIHQRLLEQGIP
jgi:phage protein U